MQWIGAAGASATCLPEKLKVAAAAAVAARCCCEPRRPEAYGRIAGTHRNVAAAVAPACERMHRTRQSRHCPFHLGKEAARDIWGMIGLTLC